MLRAITWSAAAVVAVAACGPDFVVATGGAVASASASVGGGASSSASTDASNVASVSSSAGSGGAGGQGEGLPRDCAAVLEANEDAPSGPYVIDPDGPGGDDPFTARCDMITQGGGWTRFHWLADIYPPGVDPLGMELSDCEPLDDMCLSPMPAAADPEALLIKNRTDGTYAAFDLDGTETAAALVAVLRDRQETCLQGGNVLQPFANTSTTANCAVEGSCDTLYYTNNDGCGGALDGWLLAFDDDGYACKAAFKFGGTSRDNAFGSICGPDDQGYLDDCTCELDQGELYYR